jgi:hypothetical protein
MNEYIPKGAWVEIAQTVLGAGERAPHIPGDTKQVPLELRVKGFLLEAARPGGTAVIETASGRRLRGELIAVNPPYSHGFGAPVTELNTIGTEVRGMLRSARGGR